MLLLHSIGGKRLTAILFLNMVLVGMTQLVIPLHALQLGASPGDLGILIGAVGVGATLLAIPSGALSAYLGLGTLIYVSFFLWIAAGAISFLAPALSWLVGCQFLIGLADVFLWIAAVTSLAELAPPGKQAEVQSWSSGIMGVGAAVGPVLGGYVGQAAGFRSVFALTSVLAMLGLVLCYRLPTPQHPKERGPLMRHVIVSHFDAVELIRTNGPARLAALLTLLGTMSWVTVGPSFYIAYLNQLGVSADVIGLLTTLRAGAGTLGRFGFALFATRTGVLVATFSSFALGGLALAATPFLTAVPVLALVGSLGEAADRLRIPGIQTMMADGTDTTTRALSFSLISFSWALGSAVMPPILGVIADRVSLSAAFLIPGSLAVLVALVSYASTRRRTSQPSRA